MGRKLTLAKNTLTDKGFHINLTIIINKFRGAKEICMVLKSIKKAFKSMQYYNFKAEFPINFTRSNLL